MVKKTSAKELSKCQTFSSYASEIKKLDFQEIDKRGLNQAFLQKELPEGQVRGNEFCLGSPEGEKGQSFKLSLVTGEFNQFNPGEEGGGGKGLATYFSRIWKCKVSDSARRLAEKLGVSDAISDGDLILPVPSGCEELKLKPNLQKNLQKKYSYLDTDGNLIGYRLRYQEPNGKKFFHTYTYRMGLGWSLEGWDKILPLYGMDQLNPSRKEDPVIMVEGEKCCDFGRALGGDLSRYIWLSWSGGAKAVDLVWINALKNKTVYLWPDNDSGGRQAMSRLAMRLQEIEGVKIKLIKGFEDQPEGWDIADWTPESGIDIEELIKSASEVDSIDSMLQSWVYWVDGKRFIDRQTGRILDKEAFNDLHACLVGSNRAAKILLENMTLVKVSKVAYRPNKDSIFVENGKQFINTWIDYSVEAQEGDVTPFLQHMEKLVPEERERNHLLDWLAFNVQFVGTKIKHAIILQGNQGIGKSFLAVMMNNIFGKENVGTTDNVELTSDYCPFLDRKHLVIVHELHSNERREVAEKLKSWISEDTVRIKEKYQPTLEYDNVTNFLTFTNHKDAMIIEPGDRRYFVIFSPMTQQTPEYYDNLFSWMHKNLGQIKNYLLNRDISKFNPNTPPPMTDAKRIMMNETKGGLRQDLETLMEENSQPFNKDVFTLVQLEDVMRQRGMKRVATKTLTHALESLGVTVLGKVKLADSTTPNVYCWKKHEEWSKISLDEIRKEFEPPF